MLDHYSHVRPSGNIDGYGGYLFQCLLGENRSVFENAATPGVDIDVEVLIENGDSDLQRLRWEMMFAGKRPLDMQKARKVAITRVVRPAKSTGQPAALRLPLKVLFVVGSEIDDTLRPGAEPMGRLRRVPVPLDAAFQKFRLRT